MVKLFKWFTDLFRRPEEEHETARAAYIAEQERSEVPWACFEVTDLGAEADRVRVEFNWNSAFIEQLNRLGFQAETEEDSVQLFFYASQMRPTELAGGDDTVQSVEHPTLSRQSNTLRT